MLKNITMKKKMFYALSALLLCSACTTTPRNPFEEPARPAGQESVLKLASRLLNPLGAVLTDLVPGVKVRSNGMSICPMPKLSLCVIWIRRM